MGENKEPSTIFLGTLERFGYELTVACFSEQECIDKLMVVYEKQYRQDNHTDPRKDIRISGVSYYDNALEDVSVRQLVPGVVEWL